MSPLDSLIPGLVERCDSFGTLSRAEITLENNTWGEHLVSSKRQCIGATPEGASSRRFGWHWDYPAEAMDEVKAYPEVIFGKKPWAWATTNPALPRYLSPVPSIKVNYALDTQAGGRFNTAFEIWLTRTATATKDDIVHEVMFWVNFGGNPRPAGYRNQSDVSLGDSFSFDWWTGNISYWKYDAIVFNQPIHQGTLDFGLYLKFLVDQGRLDPSLYIASLELGNEVWYGAGRTVVTQYGVYISDNLVIPAPVAPVAPVPPVAPVNPVTPVEPVPVAPIDPGLAHPEKRARIEIEVPPEAIVYIDDHLMQSTGIRRVFWSPILESNDDFKYHLRIEVGLSVTQREVIIRPGAQVFLSFLTPEE